jgi:glutamate synthase (NADPH/NADH) small chain
MCTNPVRIIGHQVMTGVEYVRKEMCDLDTTGRPKPAPIEGSHFTLDADVFIAAIGQGPNPLLINGLPELRRGKRGKVIADNEFRTSMRKVLVGGDVAKGAATVILAMGAAKSAAHAIHKMLPKE